MRIIKFRAWDFNNNQYWYQFDIFSKNGLAWFANEVKRDWIVEQFIELADKNGVDIYEGDIVIGTDSENKVVFTESIVNYEDGILRFEDLPVSDAFDFGWEIIGNIHQNKNEKY